MRCPVIRGRRPRYDVVFYTPWIGAILSSRGLLPPGGAERQVLMLATYLAKRGLRVGIVAFGSSAELPHQVEDVTIIPRRPYEKQSSVLGRLREILTIWRALQRAPARFVVYRGGGIELGLVAMHTWIAPGRRLVFSTANVVDFDFRQLMPNRLHQWIYELGVRLADEIVVQTEEQVELCRAAFGRTARLIKSICPPGEPQDDAPEAFLWVGRLVSYKRPLEYVALAKAVPQAHFWMVGVPIVHDGASKELADRVMAECERVPNLEMLPPCSHDEVGRLMSRAVASVNTADFEGMPNVLLEAWSRGVPALVLNHDPGGVVSSHGLGSFAAGSTKRLKALACDQWETRDARNELALRCRAYITKQHAPELIADQWLDLLAPKLPRPVAVASSHESEPACAA